MLVTGGVGLQAQRLPVRAYTTADGLLHNGVNRIVKDSRGLLWFCTNEGLSRFDGYAFVNFGVEQGVPPGAVTDLMETRGGEYWVATVAGLFRYDLAGRFSSAVLDDSNRRSPAVTVLLEGHDQTIWSGTQGGLYRLEQSQGQGVLRQTEIGMPDTPADRVIADVLEEVVNNAARHARCGRVAIGLSLDGSGLVLTISDDGVGFDTSLTGAGHGLVSIRRRAKRLKGTLAIASGDGAGTSVVLTVPHLPR